MNGTQTHWHERYFDVVGKRENGEPFSVAKWRPVTPLRAAWLLDCGLPNVVRLGPPEFDADAAHAAATGGVE